MVKLPLLFWIWAPTPVPQSMSVRIELSMTAGALDTSQLFSAASSEDLHVNQPCADLQKLIVQEELLDCTLMATKDKREIKVCGIFCKFIFSPAMHVEFRHCVRFFAYARQFSVVCFRLT